MKIKWLGHSAFLITSDQGTKIITDPYEPGGFGAINYGKINETADVVTVSHDHADHNFVSQIQGNPQVLDKVGSAKVKGIEFRGVATFHDTSQGTERGPNTVFCFDVDGVRICHTGDLGHQLSPQQAQEVGPVDVLLVPVGGAFTVDAAGAAQLCEQLKPKVVIPMHFKTEKILLPLTGVEDFTKGRSPVRQVGSSEVEIRAGQLPAATETVVLQPAL